MCKCSDTEVADEGNGLVRVGSAGKGLLGVAEGKGLARVRARGELPSDAVEVSCCLCPVRCPRAKLDSVFCHFTAGGLVKPWHLLKPHRRCWLGWQLQVKGGAMKQTVEGDWAHVACAMWITECYFPNVEVRVVDWVQQTNQPPSSPVVVADDGANRRHQPHPTLTAAARVCALSDGIRRVYPVRFFGIQYITRFRRWVGPLGGHNIYRVEMA